MFRADLASVKRVVAVACLVACSKAEPVAQSHTTSYVEASSSAPTIAAPANPAAESHTTSYANFLTAAPRGGRSLGHTSVVFEVKLQTGERSVFKPSSKRGPHRYKGEIAAYRLGRALGIPNVPPAFFRTFSYPVLATALANDLFNREAVAPNNEVKGAIMPWIEKLEFLPLEQEPKLSAWRASLKKDAPADDESLAAQISTMIVFDWLTGNWDRWSGGNVGWSERDHRVLFVDNDGAFFENPPKDGLVRSQRYLGGIEKFSKSFVASVRALDREALAKAIGDETDGVPLLSNKALDGVESRRQTFLAQVRDDQLVFP